MILQREQAPCDLGARDVDWHASQQGTTPADCVPVPGNHPTYILYTSGTTGNPKGVVLSQANFKAQTDVLISTPLPQKLLERDIQLESLCFLPLCHVMGRTADYHLQLALGTTINFAENMKTIQKDLEEKKSCGKTKEMEPASRSVRPSAVIIAVK